MKDRIALEVQFGKYAFVAYDLFVKHLAFYVGDKIDVGIAVLPMKSLAKRMSQGVSYYEGELYNVVRHGRGVPAVPLALCRGWSPDCRGAAADRQNGGFYFGGGNRFGMARP